MGKGRLEAFSDGVIAIIITIMVLEMKVPHGSDPALLKKLGPVFISYVLSFVYIGIYWNNHHHLLHATREVNGKVLWANMHLLFWLSLVPFVSGWMGENNFTKWPVILYGIVLLMAAIAYYILTQMLARNRQGNEVISTAIGKDVKGKVSLLIYLAGIAACFIHPWIGFILYTVVAIIWFIPDNRIEKNLSGKAEK